MKPSHIIILVVLVVVIPLPILAEERVEQSEPPRDGVLATTTSTRAALDEAMSVNPERLSGEELAVAKKRIVECASDLVNTLENAEKWLADKEYLRYAGILTYATGVEGVLARPELIDQVGWRVPGVEFDASLAKEFPSLAIQPTLLRSVLESNLVAGAIAALPYGPGSNGVCSALLQFAQRATSPAGKLLAQTLSTNQITPAYWVGIARNIARREFDVGQPFELGFRATDGSDVDSSKLRGKVLLVNFWATTCPSSMQSLPELKSLYERYHDRGLEIVGINQDGQTEPVLRVLQQRNLPWPTHLDTGGLEAGLAERCGIFAIPNNWLVDRRGVLREIGAHSDLETKVKLLLSESP